MTFSGLARACAGGLAADGIHDFTTTGILKDSDGNALTNTAIKLLFKNNRGHDFGDGRAKKNAKHLPDITKGQAEVANRGRKYRIDFPVITGAARRSNPAMAANTIRTQWHNTARVTTRYTKEWVEVNLRKGAGVHGVQVFRKRRTVN